MESSLAEHQHKSQAQGWELTQTDFVRLLSWLDAGQDSGGERYLEMRRRLHSWFDRKNCLHPETLADETLNRVARRLSEIETITDAAPAQYCYITANYVWRESLRAPQFTALPETLELKAAADTETRETKFACLESCLAQLMTAERDLVLRYYTGAERAKIEQRQALAGELALSANALSLRMFRLRARLESCVKGCITARA